ncbi:MAG: prepilin-type N-terminal cleavage/methylation domain-containing protein [Verrucomicrobia bacterium]|nr:prepilin-type N-terminal cleavage/methylation domain-containing protein [Verrucomicrobiota bacterium]
MNLRCRLGFTLLEVMIAMALFFMAIFAILGVVSQGLAAARILQSEAPDAGSLAAELFLADRLEEGWEEGDFGELHPDFLWRREITEVGTNGLFRVDFTIVGVRGQGIAELQSSMLLWRPESSSAVPGVRR